MSGSSAKTLQYGSMALLGAAGLAYLYYQNRKNENFLGFRPDHSQGPDNSKQKLINVLEDLHLEYQPYYVHYFHLITALQRDYGDRPQMVSRLKESIEKRLHEKTREVQHEVVVNKHLMSEKELSELIKKYISDAEIERMVNLFDKNNLRVLEASEKPDFELKFPRE